MIRIGGEAARADLEAMIEAGATVESRESSAWGLIQLGGADAVQRVMGAISDGTIRPQAAWALRECSIDDAAVLAWLGSDRGHERQAVLHLIDARLRGRRTPTSVSPKLARALESAFADARVTVGPGRGQRILEALAKIV